MNINEKINNIINEEEMSPDEVRRKNRERELKAQRIQSLKDNQKEELQKLKERHKQELNDLKETHKQQIQDLKERL